MLHSSNGVVQEYQDAFLRDIVKKFHYKECATFMQLFKSLVREDSPDSLSVITSIVNGQRGE